MAVVPVVVDSVVVVPALTVMPVVLPVVPANAIK